MNHKPNLNEVIAEKLEDLTVSGFIAEVTPLEAEVMGAFYEDAISEEEAQEATYD
jgi:hypothetical protein